jgi:hypothetical protein
VPDSHNRAEGCCPPPTDPGTAWSLGLEPTTSGWAKDMAAGLVRVLLTAAAARMSHANGGSGAPLTHLATTHRRTLQGASVAARPAAPGAGPPLWRLLLLPVVLVSHSWRHSRNRVVDHDCDYSGLARWPQDGWQLVAAVRCFLLTSCGGVLQVACHIDYVWD